ncbi:MAG: FtsX-like permease family protein [Methanoregula sp.]|nr:FtsX-like permease family protein [Methanoregula sp.]
MRQQMDYVTFIIAGLRNKPGRNLATLFCFAFIAANIFLGQFLIAGAAGGVDRGVTRMGADHLIVPAQYMVFLRGQGPDNTMAIIIAEPSNYRIKSNIMQKLGNVTGVSAMSPQLYVSMLNIPELSPVPVDIYGFDSETDFTIQPWLQKPLKNPLKPGEIIVGSGIDGKITNQVSVADKTYTIAGRLDPTRSPIDYTIFLRMDDAYALAATKGIVSPSAPKISPGDVNAILIRDSVKEDQNAVTKRIMRVFSSLPEYKYVSVIGRHFTLDPMAEDIQAIPGLLNVISIFVVIVALPLIALIAAMVAHERQREIGLLKSMGAKRKIIFLLVIAESLMLATIGGIAGVGASMLALFLMNDQGILNSALKVSFQMPPLPDIGLMAGVALLVVIAIGSISSLWPAYQSSRMNPYDAIRSER